MPRKPRLFGKTAGQRAYDMRRAAQKRGRETRERDERRQRMLARRGYRMGCLLPVALVVAHLGRAARLHFGPGAQ